MAHRTDVGWLGRFGGRAGNNLERIRLPLRPDLAAGGARAGLAQRGVGIAAFAAVIPQNAHRALVIALDLDGIGLLVCHKIVLNLRPIRAGPQACP